MCRFSEDSKQKLGKTLVYIAERAPQLSKTKLLKLLFLMEEYMVKRYHVPFLALPYEVWQAGPVAKDIFIDLRNTALKIIVNAILNVARANLFGELVKLVDTNREFEPMRTI